MLVCAWCSRLLWIPEILPQRIDDHCRLQVGRDCHALQNEPLVSWSRLLLLCCAFSPAPNSWPPLNLNQNAREGWKNSYWKHQVLIFYPLGKNSEKPYGGVGGIHPSPFIISNKITKCCSIILTKFWNRHVRYRSHDLGRAVLPIIQR